MGRLLGALQDDRRGRRFSSKYAAEAEYKKIVDDKGPLGYGAGHDTGDVQIHSGLCVAQPVTHVLYQDDIKLGVALADVLQGWSRLTP